MARPDLYISVDVEADGPYPGLFSMLSLGMAVAGSFDGGTFRRAATPVETFYAELAPISERFDSEAIRVSNLDRDRLIREGEPPVSAMSRAGSWIRAVAGPARPVLVAYPLGFDWMFTYYYFLAFTEEGSPFGFSSHLDMKTMYAAKARTTVGRSTKSQMEAHLLSTRPHTHNALEDALEQADLFANLFEWRP
jgi:hypothetical protein